MVTSICLKTEDRPVTVLQVSQTAPQFCIEEILSVSKTVFDDAYYEFSIISDEEVKFANVYLNDIKIGRYYGNGLAFDRQDGKESILFRGQLGFARLSLEVFGKEQEPIWYYSEYASILIKPDRKGRAMDEMLRYIYENQSEILLEKREKSTAEGYDRENLSDLWSRIVIIEDIIKTYEACYGYFKSNSRCKFTAGDVVDKVEKLQNIDSRTISYMVSHPDLLRQSHEGIRFGGSRYLPNKTLMQQKQMSQDIYENQAVKSFLNVVAAEIQKLRTEINRYLGLFLETEQGGGYIISSTLFYESAKETLIEYQKRIEVASNRLDEIQWQYEMVLNVATIDCQTQPKPTMVFMTIPQYNRIYMCMARWFGYRGFDFTREKVMLSFIDAPSVYEYYVLVKLVNQIKTFGYDLLEAYHANYPVKDTSRHIVKEFCNTFVYQGEDSRLTLYYEPVIYDEDSRQINNISIYRNNTVSFRNEEVANEGHYYVPDYLIKYEKNGVTRYLVCDAKYSPIEKIRTSIIPGLTYKYLVSLSTIEPNESIDGLVIFYGLLDKDSSKASFYNKAINEISPLIETCPLSEGLMTWQQDANLLQVIQAITNR